MMKRLFGGMMILTLFAVGTARAADAPEAYNKKCKACHSIGGQGGPMAKNGGPLDGVAAKHDAAWLTAYIADPKSKIETSKMPKVKLSPEESDEIVKYLMTLK